jgi:hypothetical protein
MKPKNIIFVLLVFLVVGRMQALFVIKDVRDGATSGWIRVGESFHGYMVERYDPASETLSLRIANTPLQVKLQDGKTKTVGGPADRNKPVNPGRSIRLEGAMRSPINLEPSLVSTLADAIAQAGGLSEGAQPKGVKVIRREPDGRVFVYTVDASANATGKDSAAAFVLRPDDSVYIPNEKGTKK